MKFKEGSIKDLLRIIPLNVKLKDLYGNIKTVEEWQKVYKDDIMNFGKSFLEFIPEKPMVKICNDNFSNLFVEVR
jgi:hypothetical protein